MLIGIIGAGKHRQGAGLYIGIKVAGHLKVGCAVGEQCVDENRRYSASPNPPTVTLAPSPSPSPTSASASEMRATILSLMSSRS